MFSLRSPTVARAAAAVALLLGLATWSASRPSPQDGAPTPLATYVDPASGERHAVWREAYLEHLYLLVGRAELSGLLHGLLLESEARRLGVGPTEEAVQAKAAADWQEFVDLRFAGDALAAEVELVERGFTADEFRAQLLDRARRSLLEEAIVLAAREVTEDLVVERFSRDFGDGGVRVAVRHVYLNRARVEQDMIRAGWRPDQLSHGAVEAELQRRLTELRAELEDGTPFAELARRASHDIGTNQTGGLLANYNYDRFGPEFARGVRAAEVGELFGPLLTPTGGHLGLVDERTVTQLDDVRDALEAALAAEPASAPEREHLQRRLLDAAEIETR